MIGPTMSVLTKSCGPAARVLLLLAVLMAIATFGASPARAKPHMVKYTYHVCRNDTVKSVAEQIGVTEMDLRRWNRNTIRGNSFTRRTQGATYYASKPYEQESVGKPNAGSLVGGINLDCDDDDRGPGWKITAQRVNMYGTPETIRAIRAATIAYRGYFNGRGIEYVPLAIGNLSRRFGGALPPHLSHQSGRDVDVGLIRLENNRPGHFADATTASMDDLRTWMMLKSFLDAGDVQYIFLHRTLVAELRQYVEQIYATDTAKLDRYLEYFKTEIIQGDEAHSSHIHIRFKCPEGDERCVP